MPSRRICRHRRVRWNTRDDDGKRYAANIAIAVIAPVVLLHRKRGDALRDRNALACQQGTGRERGAELHRNIGLIARIRRENADSLV